MRVNDVIEWFEELAPPSLAEEWDRIGLQLGDPTAVVERVMVALTVTPAVVAQARSQDIDLIVTHHPVIFKPLHELRWDRPVGSLLSSLIEAKINVYAAHTNYDATDRGTSLVLATRVGLTTSEPLIRSQHQGSMSAAGLGRVGPLLAPMKPAHLLAHLCAALDTPYVEHCGPVPSNVRRVAVMGGSGGSFLHAAAEAQVDAYITGDIDFHDALLAHDLGLWVIDAGHFATERSIVPFWKEFLTKRAARDGMHPQIITAKETDPFEHFCFDKNAEEGV